MLLFPRWEANLQYGVVLPASTTMRHWRPGRWEYRYTIDGDRCRVVYTGRPSDAPVIAVLGDSYAMGMGVNDDETFSAVLAAELGQQYRVLNCGSPGWGLTQEVRRFHEYALAYGPRMVVLQFCANDPEDGARDAVARYVEGRPVFSDTQRRFNPVFRAL